MPGGDPGFRPHEERHTPVTTEVLDSPCPGPPLSGVGRDHDGVLGQAIDVLVAFHRAANGKAISRQGRGEENELPFKQELANISSANRLLEIVRQNPDCSTANRARPSSRLGRRRARLQIRRSFPRRHTASRAAAQNRVRFIDIAGTDDRDAILRQNPGLVLPRIVPVVIVSTVDAV